MSFLAIMNWDEANRVVKYQEFVELIEATVFVTKGGILPGTRIEAFIVPHPGGQNSDWLIDPVAKTISLDPLVSPKPTIISYREFQSRFVIKELDALINFLFTVDTISGELTNARLLQFFQLVIAEGRVDLEHSSTLTFMDALVTNGIITARRKGKILI